MFVRQHHWIVANTSHQLTLHYVRLVLLRPDFDQLHFLFQHDVLLAESGLSFLDGMRDLGRLPSNFSRFSSHLIPS